MIKLLAAVAAAQKTDQGQDCRPKGRVKYSASDILSLRKALSDVRRDLDSRLNTLREHIEGIMQVYNFSAADAGWFLRRNRLSVADLIIKDTRDLGDCAAKAVSLP